MRMHGTSLVAAMFVTLCFAAGANTPALAEARLAVRLGHGEAAGEIVFELANEGSGPVSVLRSGTPLETRLSDDVFDVRRVAAGGSEGGRPVYTGRVYKRVAPRPGDFVELAPGESLAARVELERYYDVPEAGGYEVSFSGRILVATEAGETASALVDATPDVARLEVTLWPSLLTYRARPPTYNGCSAEQQSILIEATGAAETIVGEALASMNALPEAQRATAPRYLEWFGRYSAANYRAVSTGYAAILSSLSGETLNYDCTCDEEGVFAYVYPFQLHDIYLCPTFFRVSLLGTDSRAGTLVHELSHFEALLGTDDDAYGQGGAARLASLDPANAIDNADNYEYFAENTPALSMDSGDAPVTSSPDDASTTPPDRSRFTALPLDTEVRGTIEAGMSARFTLAGADTLSLAALDGEASLRVFDDPSLATEALVCSVDASGGELAFGVCGLSPPPGVIHFIEVSGLDGTTYELVATARSTAEALPPGLQDDPPIAAQVSSDDSANGVGAAGWGWLLWGGGTLCLRLSRTARATADTARAARRA